MIRPLAVRDIAQLAEQLAELPLLQHYRRTADVLAADLRAALERGDRLLVHDHDEGGGDPGPRPGTAPAAAAEVDGLVWFLPSSTLAIGGYLRLLAVVPGAERRGLGSALLAEFERTVAEWSRHAFLLVSDFNGDAQRFYARHGYTQVGRLPGLVIPEIDELLYWRRLSG